MRAGTAEDLPIVVDSWVMSYRLQARAKDAGRAYLRGHKRAVRACLARPGVALLVACLDEDPDTVIGWSCVELGVVHYVFVKEKFRGHGFAKALLDGVLSAADKPDRVTYTHKSWRAVTEPGWSYDPYAFQFGAE